MPTIHVEMIPGRTTDQKRNLAKTLTDGFIEACGGNRDGVHVVITEVETENWAVGGELLVDRMAAAAPEKDT